MADIFAEAAQYSFFWRGLLMCMLVGVSGGVLGCLLVLRRMSLMGDALAHSLLPGMGLAWLVLGPGMWSLFAGALAAGLLTAGGSTLITRVTRTREDAAFGAMFVMFFGIGIALVSASASSVRVDLLHFLFGNILAVGPADLWLALGVSTLTLAVFALFWRDIQIEAFDASFYRACGRSGAAVHAGILALVVLNLVAALQAMGIVLSLGLFLLPAVTASLWCVRLDRMLGLSALIASLGGCAGFLLSFRMGIPSGSAIVGVLGAAFLLTVLISPRRGLLKAIASRRRRRARMLE